MSRLNIKAQSLQDLLQDAAALAKQAADQTIKHISDPVQGQDGIGREMQKQQHDAIPGIAADDPAQVPAPKEQPRDIDGGVQESVTKAPDSVLNVTKMDSNTVKKSASLHDRIAKHLQASLSGAPIAKKAAEEEETVPTGIGVMRKIASVTNDTPAEVLQDIAEDLRKLASTNPLFCQACEAVAIRKLAAEAEALAAATGTTPEEAGQLLADTIASDPEAAAELQGEVEAEAAEELANAEAAALEQEDSLNTLAANASANLGIEVSPADMEEALAEVEAYAAANGIDPVDLIAAAAEEMQAANGAAPSDEEVDAVMQAAAEQGISPEELIQGLAGDVASSDEGQAKTATLNALAGTRRGQLIGERLSK